MLFLCRVRLWSGKCDENLGPKDLQTDIDEGSRTRAEAGVGSGVFMDDYGKGGNALRLAMRFHPPAALAAAIRVAVVTADGDATVLSGHGVDL